MKKLLIILVLGLICFNPLGIAHSEEPYVYLSFDQKEVRLGSYLLWDKVIPEALTVKVNSNCFHGSVVASMSSLKNSIGGRIDQDRVYIKTTATGGFISLSRPVIISQPAFGSHDIQVDFMVKANGELKRAGKYSGVIAFTILPPV